MTTKKDKYDEIGKSVTNKIWLACLPLDRLTTLKNDISQAIRTEVEKERVKYKGLENKYRKKIWLSHGCSSTLYGDDGEMQCLNVKKHSFIDFKRQPIDEIEKKLFDFGVVEICYSQKLDKRIKALRKALILASNALECSLDVIEKALLHDPVYPKPASTHIQVKHTLAKIKALTKDEDSQ